MRPTVVISSFVVSVLPADHPESTLFDLTVAERGRGRWAILRGRGSGGMCWNRNGGWDYEPSPSNREDDWLDDHRFTMDEALSVARRIAPDVTINGVRAADVLEVLAARRHA